MTYKDLMLERMPWMVDDDICGGVSGCPHYYLGAEKPEYCSTGNPTDARCRKCWNREVKEND